jgi:hypothetical protein
MAPPKGFIEEHDDGSITVTLEFPVEIRTKAKGDDEDAKPVTSKVIEKITFKPAIAAHLMAIDEVKGPVSRDIALMEQLSDYTQKELRRIRWTDHQRCVLAVQQLLGKSQPTGEESSEP